MFGLKSRLLVLISCCLLPAEAGCVSESAWSQSVFFKNNISSNGRTKNILIPLKSAGTVDSIVILIFA